MDPFSQLLEYLDETYAPVFAPLTIPFSKAVGLPHLPSHVPTFLFALALYQSTFVVAGYISSFLSKHYRIASKKTQYQWKVHAVSQVNALVLTSMSLACFGIEALDKDRVYGWDDRAGRLNALACGYFFWDVMEVIFFYGGISFFLHGAACFGIFAMGFRPFILYYAPRSLIWEASTPFLNIHWWLDKTGRTGSMAQLINGVFLMVTFFLVRLVYGAYITFAFWKTLYGVRFTFPMPLIVGYVLGNACLNVLNWIWFSKMIAALTKRFPSEGKANGEAKVVKDEKTE